MGCTSCEAHRVAFTEVNAVLQEHVNLEDLLGVNVQKELARVLRTEGEQLGWRPKGRGKQVYSKRIHPQVSMEIDLKASPLCLRRRVSERVARHRRVQAQQRLEELLEEVGPAYNLAFNQLLDRTYGRAIRQFAEKIGTIVGEDETYDEEQHTHDLEIRLRIPM